MDELGLGSFLDSETGLLNPVENVAENVEATTSVKQPLQPAQTVALQGILPSSNVQIQQPNQIIQTLQASQLLVNAAQTSQSQVSTQSVPFVSNHDYAVAAEQSSTPSTASSSVQQQPQLQTIRLISAQPNQQLIQGTQVSSPVKSTNQIRLITTQAGSSQVVQAGSQKQVIGRIIQNPTLQISPVRNASQQSNLAQTFRITPQNIRIVHPSSVTQTSTAQGVVTTQTQQAVRIVGQPVVQGQQKQQILNIGGQRVVATSIQALANSSGVRVLQLQPNSLVTTQAGGQKKVLQLVQGTGQKNNQVFQLAQSTGQKAGQVIHIQGAGQKTGQLVQVAGSGQKTGQIIQLAQGQKQGQVLQLIPNSAGVLQLHLKTASSTSESTVGQVQPVVMTSAGSLQRSTTSNTIIVSNSSLSKANSGIIQTIATQSSTKPVVISSQPTVASALQGGTIRPQIRMHNVNQPAAVSVGSIVSTSTPLTSTPPTSTILTSATLTSTPLTSASLMSTTLTSTPLTSTSLTSTPVISSSAPIKVVNTTLRAKTTTSASNAGKIVITVTQGKEVANEIRKISEEIQKIQKIPREQRDVSKIKELQQRLRTLLVSQKIKLPPHLLAGKKTATTASSSGTSNSSIMVVKGEGQGRFAQLKTLAPKEEEPNKQSAQDKANRIVAEAIARAKMAGHHDIPKVMDNIELPAVSESQSKKSKKSKEKKQKTPKEKKPKEPKPPKQPKEKKEVLPKKKSLAQKTAALKKLKAGKKRKRNESEDMSDLDETPPMSPPPEESLIQKRRSGRNTNRKKYTDDYDFKITDDEDSSSDDDDGKPNQKEDAVIVQKATPTLVEPDVEADVEVDVVGEVETANLVTTTTGTATTAASTTTKFFQDNPDEAEANIVDKILGVRLVKGQADTEGEEPEDYEEFFVKFRNYSYLHCEWATEEKLTPGDPRIQQKIRRYKQKRAMTFSFFQDMDEELFNPDYVQVDRVLEKSITKDPVTGEVLVYYLVKWCSLPYEDSTWELDEDVDGTKVKWFEKFVEPPTVADRKRVSRPTSSAWVKLDETPTYKGNNVLRDYQLEGLNWLKFCWYNKQNCILADEMGLGKTIQSISFLIEIMNTGIKGPFLVIVPLSTIGNWQREFDTWSEVNTVIYHGSSYSRHMIAEYEMFYKDEQGIRIPEVYKFQALVTTYEIVLADCEQLSEIEWRAVIIDEAHRLKNRNCKLLEGLKILDMEHRVLLTGTPLQNNIEELFSLLQFLEPGRFHSLTDFMEDFGDLKTERQVEKLQQLLRPMMLRRLKEDVEKNLAPKEETIIEVELTNIQKKYYRAILEKNFNFLCKGSSSTANVPNLMNTMMELRKCCNHPFLIKGAEQQIMANFHPADSPQRHLLAMIQSAGKLVLIDKLLPKLKEGGHKVLIFSQMVRCLDILEDYLMQKRYPFERIDGRVRGNLRQSAIDRFSKPDSDRFVFLLCTRAGGLGINLTAADTVIIFDSDWNPQNDLQAQARCHRIGQKKSVKVYRLITRNSYEREMFDKASMKLGLDKAVLQSMRGTGADKDKDTVGTSQQPFSKQEIEELLRKGAYGALMEDNDAGSKFCEEDIDMILQRRTKVIQLEMGIKGSSFAKASFSSSADRSDINLDDPDFWMKWAKRADLDTNELQTRDQRAKIIDTPRQRKQTRRFGENEDMVEFTSSESENEDQVQPTKATRTRRQHQPSIAQTGWTRLECFRVEKGLLTFGWGRWDDLLTNTRFKRRLQRKDVEAISRTMLVYCLKHYKGDENIKSFIWDLITPLVDGVVKDYRNHKGLSAPVPRGRKGKKRKEEQINKVNYDRDFKGKDPEELLTDQGYKNHLKRHCNKVLLRVRLLYYLKQEVIGDLNDKIADNTPAHELPIPIPVPEGDRPAMWWDEECDRSLLVGVYKHGYEKYFQMRNDSGLCFLDRCGPPDQAALAKEANDDMVDGALDVEGEDGMCAQSGMKGDNEYDESMSPASTRACSPIPKHFKADLSTESLEPGKYPFPSAPDLNTRLRRLVTAYQRNYKKMELKRAKRERREQVKKERVQEAMKQKMIRKQESAQKWSRREEADFYRILAAFGVEYDQSTGTFDWNTFKKLAKLERKKNERMVEYYHHFRAMCLRVCNRLQEIPKELYNGPSPDFVIEQISEERANKCLHRIDLLLKVRNEVLHHPKLEERLKFCKRSMELPEWWELGKHDHDLIVGVARYGVNRMESQQQMMSDPDLSFFELKDKYPQSSVFTGVPNSVNSGSNSMTDIPQSSEDMPLESTHNAMLAQRIENRNDRTVKSETKLKAEDGQPMTSDPHLKDSSNSAIETEENESKIMNGDETNQEGGQWNPHLIYAIRWPKDRVIVHRLEQLCHLVLKGMWPGRRHRVNPDVAFGQDMASVLAAAANAKINTEGKTLEEIAQLLHKKRRRKRKLEMQAAEKAKLAAILQAAEGGDMALDLSQGLSAAKYLLKGTEMLTDEVGAEGHKKKKRHKDKHKRKSEDTGEEKHHHKRKKKKHKHNEDVFLSPSKLGDDDPVAVVNPTSGEFLSGSIAPLKKDLEAFLEQHPDYQVFYPPVEHDSYDAVTEQVLNEKHEKKSEKKKSKRLRNPDKLVLSKLTGEERIGIIHRPTNQVMAGKYCPTLHTLTEWLNRNPEFDVRHEWEELVKTVGLPEELYDRIQAKPLPKDEAISEPKLESNLGDIGSTASELSSHKLSLQVGSSGLGGLSFTGDLSNLGELGFNQVLDLQSSSITDQVDDEGNMLDIQGIETEIANDGNSELINSDLDVPTSSLDSGVSPYMLPTTSVGMFYSPFLPGQGLQQLEQDSTVASLESTGNGSAASTERTESDEDEDAENDDEEDEEDEEDADDDEDDIDEEADDDDDEVDDGPDSEIDDYEERIEDDDDEEDMQMYSAAVDEEEEDDDDVNDMEDFEDMEEEDDDAADETGVEEEDIDDFGDFEEEVEEDEDGNDSPDSEQDMQF
ncbi:chromodomain-helicase-DNA-binding protein 8-like [Anneissia japonica]|uniref:chromodomain-helicase-DNA-binding protein 8-like n=1 Tax=Anneissia japonica TaxID=1529436 RepID=UPI0014258BF7|nr:chromodomain-helicase-DNA-binding protein 8-like [Anneissia japonica]